MVFDSPPARMSIFDVRRRVEFVRRSCRQDLCPGESPVCIALTVLEGELMTADLEDRVHVHKMLQARRRHAPVASSSGLATAARPSSALERHYLTAVLSGTSANK